MSLQINFFIPVQQYFHPSTHLPLENGVVHSYIAGTMTPKSLFTQYYGTTVLPNPCRLGTDGLIDGGMWGNGNYHLIIKDPTDTITVAEYDNVSALAVSDLLGDFNFTDNTMSVSSGSDVILQTGGTGTYQLKSTSSMETNLSLYANTVGGLKKTTVKSSAAITSDRIITLPDSDLSWFPIQRKYSQSGAVNSSGTASYFSSDSVLQDSDTLTVLSLSLTPSKSENILKIIINIQNAVNNAFSASTVKSSISLFTTSSSNSIASVELPSSGTADTHVGKYVLYMTAGTTSPITFSVGISRFQALNDWIVFNGDAATQARLLGGVMASSIEVIELTST